MTSFQMFLNCLNSFHKIIEKYQDFNINQKLILPCLEYHCTIHIKLSNSKFIHDEENYVKRYVDEVLPGLREEVEEIKNYQPDEPETNTNNLSEAVSYTHLTLPTILPV